MPVAKGAGYVLSSINQKKKFAVPKEKLTGSANDLDPSEQNRLVAERRRRREEKRRARGCRHCRRNHDDIKQQLNCNWNVCIKCIGCEKVLIPSYFSPNMVPARVTIRSCCADFKGRLSKVQLFVSCKVLSTQ